MKPQTELYTEKLLDEIKTKLDNQNLLEYFVEIEDLAILYKQTNNEVYKHAGEAKIISLLKKINLSTGSLRAPMSLKDTFSFPNVLKSIEDLLVKYGGHALAAGFSAKTENLEEIDKHLQKILTPEKLIYQNSYSNIIDIDFEEIDQPFLNNILRLDPYGIDFPMPIISTNISRDSNYILNVMKHKTDNSLCHLKFTNPNGITFLLFNFEKQKYSKEISFDEQESSAYVNSDFAINLQLKTSQNTFRGETNFQLIAESFSFEGLCK